MTADRAFDQPFRAIPDLIRLQASQRPHHVALSHDGRSLDYAALDHLMDRVAASMQRDGLRPGNTIAVCGGNSIEHAAVFLGALRAGIVVAPLAPSSTAEDLAGMIADAGATLLFLDSKTLETLAPIHQQINARCIAMDESTSDNIRVSSFDTWLAGAGTRPAPVAIQPDWPFNIIYSSGTTGTPKGIVQPHLMRWGQLQRAARFGYGANMVTLLATPLYSNTTLVSFFPTLGLGGTLVMMAKFDAANYLALAQKHRATHTMLVPVQYQRIMALPEFDRFDLSSFRFKQCTSAPFSAALKADILRRWPGGLVEFYGLTEGGGTCILAAHEYPEKLHTVGRPASGHDIRLIDENGHEVAAGEAGEVVGSSPDMMSGYHNQAAKTAEVEWFDTSGRRFIRTGDIGSFDKEGFLTLLDRKKDMIISGGFNIYSSDLESVLSKRSDVAEVAVVGVPSTRWGETPVAFVALTTGAAVSETELLAWANERLGKIQRLAAIELVDSLPRSGIGKVLKRELRNAYATRTRAPGQMAAT